MGPKAFGVKYDTWFFESSLYRKGEVHAAIEESMQHYGSWTQCAARVAQEAGDHPELYAGRMRWALSLARQEAWS